MENKEVTAEELRLAQNMAFYNQGREVPDEAKRTIQAGRLKGFTDVNPMFRIKKLTELFGPCGIGWICPAERFWLEKADNGEVKAFCTVQLRYKLPDGTWSEPVMGIGGSSFVSKTKNGLEVSDECYKMAYTDAISVACKSLGIAADVYWEKDATKYTQAEDQAQRREMKKRERPVLVHGSELWKKVVAYFAARPDLEPAEVIRENYDVADAAMGRILAEIEQEIENKLNIEDNE